MSDIESGGMIAVVHNNPSVFKEMTTNLIHSSASSALPQTVQTHFALCHNPSLQKNLLSIVHNNMRLFIETYRAYFDENGLPESEDGFGLTIKTVGDQNGFSVPITLSETKQAWNASTGSGEKKSPYLDQPQTYTKFLIEVIFSLSGPEGIKFPLPIKFSLLKQTIFKL